MIHDPPCRRKITEALMGGCPECNLIAKVREDECAAAVQRVKALGYPEAEWLPRIKVTAAIKGEQP